MEQLWRPVLNVSLAGLASPGRKDASVALDLVIVAETSTGNSISYEVWRVIEVENERLAPIWRDEQDQAELLVQ